MVVVQDIVVHPDIFKEYFICDLPRCKGLCCVEGDYGAPLKEEEIDQVRDNLECIKPFMTPTAIKKIEKLGFYERDPDAELVTQCINGRDCVFAFKDDNGIYKCAIEKAWSEGKSSFRKPISCHLYPIRVYKIKDLVAMNYNRWDICGPACKLGAEKRLPLFKFLKGPLIREFGQAWYGELEVVASEMKKEGAL